MSAQENEKLKELELEILRLSKLDNLAYELERLKIAEKYKIRVTTLDEMVVKNQTQCEEKQSVVFQNIIPWHEPIKTTDLLSELETLLNELIVFSSQYEATAIALYILHSYCIDAFNCTPILNITSPEKRCGKSTVLAILERLLYRPLLASSISPAAVYRSIEKWQPSLMIDEADTFLRDNEELRGVINSGHTRSSAYVIRCVGDNHDPSRFNTFCPKVIACIGHMPETIEDRSIIVKLRRKLPNERKNKLRDILGEKFLTLCRKCARFAEDHICNLKLSNPVIPTELNDRASDNWSPLLAIAELAGTDWMNNAYEAAVYLSGHKQESLSIGIELLQDIKNIFDTKGLEKISTKELLDYLCCEDEAPWPTYNKGKPLSARQLGKRLGEYGIKSKDMRLPPQGKNLKGYEADDFKEAFSRYISPASSES